MTLRILKRVPFIIILLVSVLTLAFNIQLVKAQGPEPNEIFHNETSYYDMDTWLSNPEPKPYIRYIGGSDICLTKIEVYHNGGPVDKPHTLHVYVATEPTASTPKFSAIYYLDPSFVGKETINVNVPMIENDYLVLWWEAGLGIDFDPNITINKTWAELSVFPDSFPPWLHGCSFPIVDIYAKLMSSIFSCNKQGKAKSLFGPGEDVYAQGSRYPADTEVTIYVIPDGYNPIPGNAKAVTYQTTDADGNLTVTMIWQRKSEYGSYDIWVDVNQNSVFDDGDVLNNQAFGAFAFNVVPEVPFGTAMTFLSMLIALVGFLGFKCFRPKFRLQ